MFRKFLITITLTTLLIAAMMFYGQNLFKFKSGVKKILVAKLEETFGDKCSIERVRFGLGSVNLEDVRLAFRDAPYEFHIDQLRLGYSIGSLVRGGGQFKKTAEEITLYKPKLILRYKPKPQAKPDVNLSLQISEEAESRYRSLIKEYDFIKRMTISEGEIVISNEETGKTIRVGKQINGWAYTDNQDKAWLRLAGHFFESNEYNMVLYGQLNLGRGGLDFINVDLHDYKIGTEIPLLIPNYFEALDGKVNGHLEITERMEPTRGFNIDGNLKLENGKLKLQSENLYVDDINIEAEIKEWNLEIKKSSQFINGSPASLTGRIKNLLEPEFDLRLVSNEIDLKEFFTTFLPEKTLPLKGNVSLDVQVSHSLLTPEVQGHIKSDSLWFLDRKVVDLTSDITYDDLRLSFANLKGWFAHAKFSGQGKIDFLTRDKILDFDFHLDGDFSRDIHNLGFRSADKCIGTSEIKIFGDIKKPVSAGQFKLVFSKQARESLSLHGAFRYSDNHIGLNATSHDGDFHLTATAQSLSSSPILNVEASNFEEIFVFINNPILDFVREEYTLNLRAENLGKNPFFVLDGSRRDNSEKLFQIIADTATVVPNKIFGDLTFFPDSYEQTKGDFELEILPDVVRLSRLSLGDWLNAHLDFSKESYIPFAGKLDISGLRLARLLTFLGSTSPKFNGDIFGQIAIHGDAKNPAYTGDLWLLDGFFRNVGPLSGELSFSSNRSKLLIKKAYLEKGETTRIQATGVFDLQTKEVDASILGSEVRVQDIIKIVTNKENIVQGNAIVQVSLKGGLPKVPIFGNIKVHDANILRFNFDEVLLDFSNQQSGNGSYVSQNKLHAGKIIFTKSDRFTLNGSGYIPLTGRDEIDVRLSGDGDFLSMLSDIESFFVKTKSDGHLDLHVTGPYQKPNFTDSKFRCQNGVLQLSRVTKKITNIEAELEVQREDYFLDIQKLQGRIQGELLSISNTKILTGLNHGIYEPLKVAGDDLNLGALTIQTSHNGIPLNIPAIMEPGEVGWYEVQGYSPEEQFFIAGPWQRPVVRGEVRLQNANLMFPFAENGVGEKSIVMNILNNINWNVHAETEKATRYVKQFSTGVYVNMEIDKEASALDFSGVFKDSTFRIEGELVSTRGEFEYADLSFRVNRFGAQFDRSSLYPIISGKAWTVIRDSSNVPYDIYLELYTVDDLTSQEIGHGRWNRLNIKLSSEHPGYQETQGDLMATLGYSSDTVQEQARNAVAYSTDRLIFRPLMRPLEREIEQALHLDVVRFSYALTRNFLNANFNNEQLRSSLAWLRSSRLLLGKYLTDDIYLLYTGELKAGVDYQFQNKGIGLQHIFGLEYRLNPQLLLQVEYDYNTLFETHKDDKKIWLRHSFPF
ncbi:MAG: translocation/assembly module TamB domain-containing protein [bacterium]